jgi:hypothetical protein
MSARHGCGLCRKTARSTSPRIFRSARLAYNRLAYPAGKIPPGWRKKAKEHVKNRVADGKDFKNGGKQQTAVSPNGISPMSVQPIDAVNWTSMGPAPIDNNAASGGYKYGLVTGRINALAVDPNNSQVAYAGATAGGLWKTTNCCSSATTWTPLWSGPDDVIQTVGAIKIDPTNSNIVYAGTGDFDAADQQGEGVMKTTDGGANWTQLGADVFAPFAKGSNAPPEQNIGAIEIDPRNPNTVMVGTRHGFFMSYDGGATWTQYNVHNQAGQSQRVSSILLDPATNTMYVAIGYPYTSKLYGNIGGGNGVYKATIPTGGAPSFTLLNNGWPSGTGGGASNSVGRIRLAASRGNTANSLTIYAQVSDYANTNALGTWVTRDGGATWTQLAGSADANYKDCKNAATNEGQDWYDLFIGVDPANDKTLYLGRTSMYKATVDAAYGSMAITNLTNVYTTSCASYGKVHPDNHTFAFVGNSGAAFLVGNDGGVYYNNAGGATANWVTLNNNLNITQFYAGQLGQNFATSTTQYAFGGAQDNGSESWDASNATQQWQARGNGGDGFFAAFDPIGGSLTAGNWYTEYTYGDLSCSTTGAGGTFNRCRGGWYSCSVFSCTNERTDWSTPFTLDQTHCTTANCKNLILGTYRLWATGTGGTTSSAWTAVSPDLTKGNVTTDIAANTIIDVHYAPSNPKAAAVGTDDGNVAWSNNIYTGTGCTQAAANTASFACTPNASATWVNLQGSNNVLPNRAIQSVAFDPTTDQTLYAAVGGFNTNTPNQPGHLFQATCAANCGAAGSWTWTDKTANLPDVPADSALVNPNNAKQVFVGTHFGFFYTNDITASPVVWQRYQNNLPNTVLQYLTTDRCATTLGLFSYGSSLYTIQLPGAGGFGTPGTSTGCSTTAPAPGATIKVASVTVTGTRGGGNRTTATAQVKIVDANGAAVAGATVSGNWSGVYSGSGTATTDGSGVATFTTPNTKTGANASYTFTTTNVSASGATWDGVNQSGSTTVP